MKKILVLLLMCCPMLSFASDPVVVGQKDKAFTVKEVEIKVGDSVRFLNEDPFFHNVFSLSDAALFDLGSFPKDEYRDITFDTAGDVEVECAIHPSMKMVIHVKE